MYPFLLEVELDKKNRAGCHRYHMTSRNILQIIGLAAPRNAARIDCFPEPSRHIRFRLAQACGL
jgi:hypothetical protein